MFTGNDSGYRTARDMKALGVHVEAIVDSRKESKADAGGVPVLRGRMITDVSGKKAVTGVELPTARISIATRSPCPAAGARSSISPAIAG